MMNFSFKLASFLSFIFFLLNQPLLLAAKHLQDEQEISFNFTIKYGHSSDMENAKKIEKSLKVKLGEPFQVNGLGHRAIFMINKYDGLEYPKSDLSRAIRLTGTVFKESDQKGSSAKLVADPDMITVYDEFSSLINERVGGNYVEILFDPQI